MSNLNVSPSIGVNLEAFQAHGTVLWHRVTLQCFDKQWQAFNDAIGHDHLHSPLHSGELIIDRSFFTNVQISLTLEPVTLTVK